jgi:rfaE bifunctional protein nucleotidyltransferase chain/domain
VQSSQKIASRQELKSRIKQWQSEGLKVVFSNGCFDIVHLGHIDYLEKARSMGDKLVIGLNSDSSVRKLKGENRPVNDVYARSRMLAAFGFVDGVTVFEEETPQDLIAYLLPDILVKGSDYTIESIVGADTVIANGGEVKTIDLVEGFSTSKLIEKIKQ